MESEYYDKFQYTKDWDRLTDDQRAFFKPFFDGKNIFLTGSAGVGKSFLLKVLFDFCESEGINISKTSSTGISALNIGGTTIHSWLGIGTAEEHPDYLLEKIEQKKHVLSRARAAKILILDEVSMISEMLLNKIDYILRKIRKNESKPFGGLQMILTGDALQLPPVITDQNQNSGGVFFFNSMAWKMGDFKVIKLTTVMRQTDSEFALALNLLRVGDTSQADIFKPYINRKIEDGVVTPIKLLSKKYDVEKYNLRQLQKIMEPAKTFTAYDWGQSHHIQFFHKNCPATKDIELKTGAQVMLVFNMDIDAGLVNGSMGIVEGFTPSNEVIVKFANGVTTNVGMAKWEIKEERYVNGQQFYDVVAYRKQIPLKLAYAISIHKSQGQTLDRAVVDLTDIFSPGQAYVALSRVKSLDGLYIRNHNPKMLNPAIFKPHPEALKFYLSI